MYQINDDLSIYVTRGDSIAFTVEAEDKNGESFTFSKGDLLRFRIFEKKNCSAVVLQKDFRVTSETKTVEISLSSVETKLGDIISKPKDYWYEIELINEDAESSRTIIGYDEDGAKIFKLFPEGKDNVENEKEG